jgi:Mn2+/Fe2+ NRAMP family transporter
MMAATAAAFAGTRPPATSPTPPGGPGHRGLRGPVRGVVFAVALLDASIIGAFAVSLSTAYAIGDVLGLKHSLHRGFKRGQGLLRHLHRADRGAAASCSSPARRSG